MGTDIHLYTEKFNKETGFWEAVRGLNPRIQQDREWAKFLRKRNEEGDIERALSYEKKADELESGSRITSDMDAWERDYYAPMVLEGWAYDGRNYNLFAILADVRNGTGFAGVKTGDGFNYIDDPRGLPDDLSDEVSDAMGDTDWMHSISYITLKELINFDWDQGTVQYGVISEHQYKELKESGEKIPDSYSGGVSGAMVVHLSNTEMDALLDGNMLRDPEKNYYTRVEWKNTYKDAVGDYFFDHTLKKLKELSDSTDGEDVRIVFGFDS